MAPFLILSLLPFLISPGLSSIPSCSSDQLSVLLRDKHFMFHSVSLFSQAPLARGSRALPCVLFYLEAVVVEKMTAAPLPLVESSIIICQLAQKRTVLRKWKMNWQKWYPLLHIDLSLISLAQTVPCLPPVRNLIQRTLNNTSWYIFIYLHCCS